MLKLSGKWEILPADHPTVIRRLVKELNYRPAGFYHNGERYNQARFHKGVLQIRMGRDQWTTVEPMAISIYGFEDGSGGTIVASRTRCGH